MRRIYKYILVKKANAMHYFSTLFGKELYMIRTDLLSIIRSLSKTCRGLYQIKLRNGASRWLLL